jgi:esterase/lipase superfamily enzyme
VLYHAEGRYTDAEILYKRSLKIREKALGPDHPNVATSLHNLAVLYHDQGRYADAELLYKRAEAGTGLSAIARDRLSRAARFPGQAFVFVHGYNNSFEDAVRRAAMIAFDLDFDGAILLFAWPSHSKLAAYRIDRKRARVASPFLVELLTKIAAELPDVKIHVLAHSTGAEIALSALTVLANKTEPPVRTSGS